MKSRINKSFALTKKNRTKKNTTKKNATSIFHQKKNFVNGILQEWKKQTHDGCIEKDAKNKYVNDYYLSFGKDCDFYNHIHLMLYDYETNHNTKNNIKYLLKKNVYSKTVHSKLFKINIFSNPKIVVKHMIQHYSDFCTLKTSL